MQQRLKVHQLGHLALKQTADGNASPFADDLGDVFGVDFFFEHAVGALQRIEMRRGLFDAALQFRNAAIANLGCDVEVGFAFELSAEMLELFFQRADGGDGLLLAFPVSAHRGALHIETDKFVVERIETLD